MSQKKPLTQNDLIAEGWEIREGTNRALYVKRPDGSYYGEWVGNISHNQIWDYVVREVNAGGIDGNSFSMAGLFRDRAAYRETRPKHDLSVLRRDVTTMSLKERKRLAKEQKALKELGAQDV